MPRGLENFKPFFREWYLHRRRNGGGQGARVHQDFAINIEVPFLFLENASFS